MNERYEKVLNFLLYSYFGIEDFEKIENDVKSVKEACAKRAYLDLARTVKYKYSTKDLENMKKKSSPQKDKDEANDFISNKNERIKTVCKVIVDCVNNDSQSIQSSDEFNNWHSTLCETIKNLMNCPIARILKDGEVFTYGQAQKWINMTLKYFWLLDLLPTSIKPEYLHVPIDSYIIEAVQSPKDKIEYGLNIKTKLKSDCWSKMDDGEYKRLQLSIRNGINELVDNDDICPIEWENKAWIGIAKYKANQ